MLKISVDMDQMVRLRKLLNQNDKRVSREVAIAINATSKTVASDIAKEVTKELATPQKTVKEQVRKGSRATAEKLGTTVTLRKSARLALRNFGARQNKKGVTYKISKTKGRKLIPSAFQGPRPGAVKVSWRGNVFIRAGKERLPIVKLSGPSPWGVFVKGGRDPVVRRDARKELRKQIEKRLRYLKLKQEGTI